MEEPKRQVVHCQSPGRLDKVLAQALGESRNQVAKLIEAGDVDVEGVTVRKPSFKVEAEERIGYTLRQAKPREELPVDFDVEVLYEDEAILVLNKPSGVVIHPAPSVRVPTLVDWLMLRGVRLSTLSGEERHGIVHRLDKETSGVLVVAKSNEAHRRLAEELQRREMGRYYLAIVDCPLREDLSVEAPIGRNPKNRLKMASLPGGRDARTDFLKLAPGKDGSEAVAARLHSGRTHQIRVHLAQLNRHILGDELYGYRPKGKGVPRVFLHAALLYLTHPFSKEKLQVEAPLFADMKSHLEKHYERSSIDEILAFDGLPGRFYDTFGPLGRV